MYSKSRFVLKLIGVAAAAAAAFFLSLVVYIFVFSFILLLIQSNQLVFVRCSRSLRLHRIIVYCVVLLAIAQDSLSMVLIVSEASENLVLGLCINSFTKVLYIFFAFFSSQCAQVQATHQTSLNRTIKPNDSHKASSERERERERGRSRINWKLNWNFVCVRIWDFVSFRIDYGHNKRLE